MLSAILHGNFSFPQMIAYIVSALAVVFLTLPVHEFAHGFVASKLGDPTPRYQGRLTLNPMAHIDWYGALCILLVGFGWAKPVQINARYFKNPKAGMAITALAGPVSNIIVAFISLILLNVVYAVTGAAASINVFIIAVQYLFYYIALINVSLAVFNLIPIPPLDGSRLLAAFLPDKQYYMLMRYERYMFIIIIFLLFTNVLSAPLNYLTGLIMNGLSFAAGLPFSFM